MQKSKQFALLLYFVLYYSGTISALVRTFTTLQYSLYPPRKQKQVEKKQNTVNNMRKSKDSDNSGRINLSFCFLVSFTC